MTNLIPPMIIGLMVGGTTLASGAAINDDTWVSVKVAAYATVSVATIVMWLDRQFNSVRTMWRKEHEKNKQWRLWVRSSIQVINGKLKLEPLPIPEDEPSSKI